MKKCLTSLFLIVFISLTATSQTKANLELLDIFNMEYVSDPQISPDGLKIVYVRNFKDVMTDKNLSNLWIINSDGSQNRPLTTGNQNDFAPRWSHQGDKIVYKSNKEDQKMKLHMMWMDTEKLFPLPICSKLLVKFHGLIMISSSLFKCSFQKNITPSFKCRQNRRVQIGTPLLLLSIK